MFGLPTCSHTALLLDGRELFTNELTAGGGRKLEYYMNLSPMTFFFAAGLMNLWEGIIIFALLTGTFLAFVLTRRRRLNRSPV
jgi:hypothetical protein